MLGFLIAGITAAVGIGKGLKAAVDNSDAMDNNEQAQRICDDSARRLNEAKAQMETAIDSLGSQKLYVLQNSISVFCDLYGKLKNIKFNDSAGIDELNKINVENFDIEEMKQMSSIATDVATSVAAGAGVGALTALGASGLGIAKGAVLGGLVAGPALAVAGLIMADKASENLNNSYSNLAQAKKIEADRNVACTVCNGIRQRAYMFCSLLTRLDALFLPLLVSLGKIINKAGTDCAKFTNSQKQTVAACVSLAKTIKTVIDTPILSEDGNLTDESATVAEETLKFIEDNTSNAQCVTDVGKTVCGAGVGIVKNAIQR